MISIVMDQSEPFCLDFTQEISECKTNDTKQTSDNEDIKLIYRGGKEKGTKDLKIKCLDKFLIMVNERLSIYMYKERISEKWLSSTLQMQY